MQDVISLCADSRALRVEYCTVGISHYTASHLVWTVKDRIVCEQDIVKYVDTDAADVPVD